MNYYVLERTLDHMGMIEDTKVDEFSSFEKALRFIRSQDEGFYIVMAENGEAWNHEGQYIGFQGFVA